MTSKREHRIEFFSKEDLSSGYQLKKAEELLDNYREEKIISLNDLIEFYNIKLYFDNDLYLTNWDEQKKTKYKEIVSEYYNKLKQYILSVDDNFFCNELNTLEYSYYENFWELINNLKVYNKISAQILKDALTNDPYQVYYILQHKGIVEKFNSTIGEFLVDYEKSAELILSLMEKSSFNEPQKLFFPKALSLLDKEEIINKYIDSENPNLNYIRLIENSIDSAELKLSAKTRLKAQKKSKELNDKILQSAHSWTIGVQVAFSKDQEEPFIYNKKDNTLEVVYSKKVLDLIVDNLNLFYVFKHLFFFTDNRNLITLVSKESELDVLERTSMKSKNEYEAGIVFRKKEYLSTLQILIFEHYLQRKGNCLENIINSFIEHLNKLIAPNKLNFRIQQSTSSYLEKIRNLTPEFEFLLKQYKTLVDENSIDLDLIQINSIPIRFSEIYSLSDKKYIYIGNDILLQLKYLFFSDQSLLYYVEPFGEKYNNLFDLLTSENVSLDHFKEYQKKHIETLIKDEYLKINQQGYVELNKEILIFIIGELHKKEVISYWNYTQQVRSEIDNLIANNLVVVEKTLLTRQERNYFNYFLNKKEFTNGYDLRNKYLHGTNPLSEGTHKMDYYKILKIIILTLIKIEDDILIKEINK